MENDRKKKKRIPVFYYLYLLLLLIAAIGIVTLLRRTERNLTEMATAAGEGISTEQISMDSDFEIQLLFTSFEFQANVKGTNTARYYLEYAITNHSEEEVPWTPPHLEYLVDETWYLADSAKDASSVETENNNLSMVTTIGPVSYAEELFGEYFTNAPLAPGQRRHGLIYLDTITGEGVNDSPEYTNVFWPGPYRLVFETGEGTYATLTFELPENAMDLSHQFLTDSWDMIYYEGAPSDIQDPDLLSAGADAPSLYGLSYQEVLMVSRSNSLCWEKEYRRPYRTYTFTFLGDLPASTGPLRLEFLRNTDWYPIPENEISAFEVGEGQFCFTLYPAKDCSKDVHTDSQKFRSGQYRLLLPTQDKWTSIEFLLE